MSDRDLDWTLSMVGLAKKAGCLIVGTPQVCGALPGGGVRLVLYSAAASGNTKKRVLDRAAYYGVRAVALDASPRRWPRVWERPARLRRSASRMRALPAPSKRAPDSETEFLQCGF